MVVSIKDKRIQEKYERFLQHKNGTLDDSKNVFNKELDKARDIKNLDLTAKNLQSRNHSVPKFAKPKAITLNQAVKLAKYGPIIEEMSAKYNVPVEVISGVILQESNGNHLAKSHVGAKGLMQLMPGTAKRFGVKDSYDPRQNIEGGTKYLRFLMDKFKGDLSLTYAGYNAGEHRVVQYGNKIPPFKETQNYVPAVMGYTQTMVNILASARENQQPIGIRA